MYKLTLTLALSILTALPATLLADPVPYANIGQVAPTTLITASESGDIIGYFVQASAAHNDVVRMIDVTSGYLSPWYFPNQTTAVGTSANFGSVTIGDVLVFELEDITTNNIYANDPTYSDDGANHAYVTSFSGGILYGQAQPSGIYVGMEDLNASISDFDYNDDTFLFTNNASKGAAFTKTSSFSRTVIPSTTPDPTPEPSTLLLLGTGILGLAGTFRTRLFRN
jgi:hypothetical protein